MQNSMPTTCQHSITATWNTPRLSLSTKTSVSLSTKTLHVLLSTKTHHLSGSTKTSHVFLSIKTPSPLSVNQNKHRAHVGILPSRNESESADVGSSAMKRNANDTSCILVTPWRITWDPKRTKLAAKQLTISMHSQTQHFRSAPKQNSEYSHPCIWTSHVVLLNARYAGISLATETTHVPSLATFAKCQNTWRNYRTCRTTWGLKRAMANNLFSSATSPTRKLKRTMCESACSSLSLSLSVSLSLSLVSLTPDANWHLTTNSLSKPKPPELLRQLATLKSFCAVLDRQIWWLRLATCHCKTRFCGILNYNIWWLRLATWHITKRFCAVLFFQNFVIAIINN